MTKEQLAAMLNGREYGAEITKAEAMQAKTDGLLVIYGASDDLVEFDGAFCDEASAYEGAVVRVYPEGILQAWEDLEKDDEDDVEGYFADKKRSIQVTADWDTQGYSWVIETDIPHATFEIMDDGEKYCRGIVIAVSDIKP